MLLKLDNTSELTCYFLNLENIFDSFTLFSFSDEITASFRRFGPLVVDWPHKAESKSYFPPKGYAFLLFQVNLSVEIMIQIK